MELIKLDDATGMAKVALLTLDSDRERCKAFFKKVLAELDESEDLRMEGENAQDEVVEEKPSSRANVEPKVIPCLEGESSDELKDPPPISPKPKGAKSSAQNTATSSLKRAADGADVVKSPASKMAKIDTATLDGMEDTKYISKEDEQKPAVVHFCVPSSQIGVIIGVGGQNVREAQKLTNTIIKINKNKNEVEPGERKLVTVSGTFKSVNCVAYIIRSQIDDDNSLVLKTSAENLGLIIGKSGSTIQRLQTDTSAKIQCNDHTGTSQNSAALITVQGSVRACLHAQHKISTLLAKAESKDSGPRSQQGYDQVFSDQACVLGKKL